MMYADSRNKSILNTKQEAGDSGQKQTGGGAFAQEVFFSYLKSHSHSS